jgi:hypothetical protein
LFAATSLHEAASQEINKMKTIQKQATQNKILMVAVISDESIAGSPIKLKIKVENRSKEGVSFHSKGKYWDYDLKLVDFKGSPVALTGFGNVVYGDARGEGSGVIKRIAAGKYTEDTLNVARVFDLTQEGDYTLTISLKLRRPNERIELKIEKMKFMIIEEPRLP